MAIEMGGVRIYRAFVVERIAEQRISAGVRARRPGHGEAPPGRIDRRGWEVDGRVMEDVLAGKAPSR